MSSVPYWLLIALMTAETLVMLAHSALPAPQSDADATIARLAGFDSAQASRARKFVSNALYPHGT
jgi:hypothetical protein